MADPQFEQFREVFDKLPQHIKAPTYCYRLAHDIVLDSLTGVDESDSSGEQQLFSCLGEKSVVQETCSVKEPTHLRSPVWQETNWTNNSGKDSLQTLEWIASTTDHDDDTAAASAQYWPNGRKRRRLPEIPKDKPAFGSSIVFKTQALSLAEEILLAESVEPLAQDEGCSGGCKLAAIDLPKHFKHRTLKQLFPFSKCPRFTEENSSPEEKILNTDADSGNSTGHSPDGAKYFSPVIHGFCQSPISPASSSGVSTTTLESLEATHRGLHKFIPRHHDEVEVEIGDPLYVQKEADDLWCEGINLRTGKSGIFPSAYVTDVEYTDFDPETVKVKKERFLLKFLGSIEVACNKGNEVLCQAIRKITGTKEGDGVQPHPCILEISDQGLRMVDKSKSLPNNIPCHDYFFFLKNISFCGFYPHDYRYFGFITKHPSKQRFACHVFIGDHSTRPVAEAVGRAFQRFYHKFIETAYPIEDIYID